MDELPASRSNILESYLGHKCSIWAIIALLTDVDGF